MLARGRSARRGWLRPVAVGVFWAVAALRARAARSGRRTLLLLALMLLVGVGWEQVWVARPGDLGVCWPGVDAAWRR